MTTSSKPSDKQGYDTYRATGQAGSDFVHFRALVCLVVSSYTVCRRTASESLTTKHTNHTKVTKKSEHTGDFQCGNL